MKRSIKRFALGFVSFVGLTGLAFGVAVLARQHRTFEAPYPPIRATDDPRVVERGRYLVFGPGHCADCHARPSDRGALSAGREVPLAGGKEFVLPVGVFRVPNITPDPETGIGRYRDEEIARMLRHGVRPDGTAMLPFMPFANLSSSDLTAVISFLRSQGPVRHRVEPHEPNLLGAVVKAFVLEPRGPSEPIREHIEPEPTPAYGRYLAHSVANCVGCHTQVDQRTGAFNGPLFGGGAVHPSNDEPDKHFVAPNLTPDPRWGWLEGWSEDAFVHRLRAGHVYPDSPMPWGAFRRITEDDARALHRYLRTLPPAAGGPDPTQRAKVVRIAGR